MNHTFWYKDAIVYQIYPRSFKDSDNDGFGDLKGIISKLDYLKDLGINTIWLSPIYDSPQEDNGYDISDYKKIYPPFGTMDDFDMLIKEMHKRDLKLIMDLVVNHTSDQHRWFKEALKDKNSKYRNYYIIKKGRKNGKLPPNNWTGFFGEKAWKRIDNSDEYYLHLFAKGQPDLNWDNKEVREEVKDILKFYLDKGVDGFRCDVITLISKDQRFLNGKFKIALKGSEYYINGPHLHEYLHELYTDVFSKYDCMTVGESVLSNIEEVKRLTDIKSQELDLMFNFDHTDIDNHFGIKWLMRRFSLTRFKKIYSKWQKQMHEGHYNTLFIENHDQRRSLGRFNTTDDEKYRKYCAKLLANTYFLMQGTPFIYQGQEIGMTSAHYSSIDDFKDVETKNIYNLEKHYPILKPLLKKSLFLCSRDNARTPFQWDDSLFAGFSLVEPWLKVNQNYKYINAKDSISDQDSILNYYKKLISFRKNNEVIRDGEYLDLLLKDRNIFAYERKLNDKIVLVISNFSTKKIDIKKKLNIDPSFKLILSNYKEKEDYLRAYESRVYINY